MILWRAGYRNALRHGWLTALAVIGVSLGVAVVSAVDLANRAAARAFVAAAEAVAGKATHEIVGGPGGLPDEVYTRLRVAGWRNSAPVVTGPVQLPGHPSATFQMIGVDPFAEPPIRSFSSRFTDAGLLAKLMGRPNTALLLRESARDRGLRPGQSFAAEAGGKRHELVLAGLIEAPDEISRLGLAAVLVTDIGTAQELLAKPGKLSRIDLVVPDGPRGAAELKAIRSLLPPEATVIAAGARAGALERMTRAFRLNLTALSLLALVVGMFLIYNTMTFSVVRRRQLIGMLRALGVTRREIFAMICGEALLIGLAGTVLGLVCGHLLGAELTRLVTRTINDLYFVMQVRELPLLPSALAKAALLGIAGTLAAACPAALEATGAPPRAVLSRSVLEARRRKAVPVAALAGLLLMLCGGGLLLYPQGGIVAAFAGLFAVILGYGLAIPGAVLVLAAALAPVMARFFGMVGKMAARGVVISLSRTGVATAALVVAVAAGVGVGIMVGGFRLTVQSWLESWLQADLYVRSAESSGRVRPALDPALVERLSHLSGAESFSLTRRANIESAGGATEIIAMGMPESTFLRYPFKEGDPKKAWESFSRGTGVILSEPYSNRHALHLGDRVTLRTGQGERGFTVCGVIYDYSSEMGLVIMNRGAYLQYYGDPSVDGMSFLARKGTGTAELAAEIRSRAGGSSMALISNRELKQTTVAIFDRTFAITGVLRILTLVVAFVGILSALMSMQVERARELAVLRALGLTPLQVWGVVTGESALIGLFAGLLALPLGIIEALILVFVINLRSFGWTMQFSIDPGYLWQAVLLSLVASILAAIYPAVRIANSSPAAALKEED